MSPIYTRSGLVALLCLGSGSLARSALPKLLPDPQPQRVFSGGLRQIHAFWRNDGVERVDCSLRLQLCQAASTTVASMGGQPAKPLVVLPGQTIVETNAVSFPAVKAATRFLIQWVERTNKVFGTTEVLVYPRNLLAQLKTLAGGEPLGVFDPVNELKPLLRAQSVAYQDLLEDGTDKFHGRLAILGPFASKQQMRERLADDIRALAKRSVAVVWLQPSPDPRAPLKPSFYTVRVGEGTVVVAQAEMVSRLAENPEAQLNLIRLAEAALRPEPLDLPEPRNSN